jgi:predicted amidohydrolase
MSWPNHFPTSGDPLRNRVAIDSQAFAQMSKAFVISACGTVDERMIGMLAAGPEAEKFLRNPDCSGGSVIVAPNSRILAGPMGPEEGILYAECQLDLAIQMKLRHDFADHKSARTFSPPDRRNARNSTRARRGPALASGGRQPRGARMTAGPAGCSPAKQG